MALHVTPAIMRDAINQMALKAPMNNKEKENEGQSGTLSLIEKNPSEERKEITN